MITDNEEIKTENENFQCLKASNKFSDADRYIVSAAATNMTNYRNIYCTEMKPKESQVQVASGKLLNIKGIADGLIKYIRTYNELINIKLCNDLCVPDLESSLLTVKSHAES